MKNWSLINDESFQSQRSFTIFPIKYHWIKDISLKCYHPLLEKTIEMIIKIESKLYVSTFFFPPALPLPFAL